MRIESLFQLRFESWELRVMITLIAFFCCNSSIDTTYHNFQLSILNSQFLEFSLAAQVRALSVYGYNYEADERKDERNVDGWHAEEFALVDN